MLAPNARHKLRPLDFRPVEHEGMRYLHLRDPLDLSGRSLFIPEPFIPILQLLDGTHTQQSIQFALNLRRNLGIRAERIQEVLAALDEACLLENDTYHAARAKALAEYRAAPHRLSPMAGESYPSDAGELTEYFSGFLSAVGASLDGASGPVYKGLLCPHIDYPRGGEVYARAWAAAAHSAREADLVIILGTDHYSEGFPLSLTRQPYATPLGVFGLPTRLMDSLARVLGPENAFAGELHHRSEHSIDLASVWLHFARGGSAVDMLPVLVGDLDALAQETLERVVEILSRETRRRRTLLVIAGDLSHVGPAFGGSPVTPAALKRLSGDDERILYAFSSQPAESLRRELDAVGENNVCGAWPLYLAARVLGPLQADRLGYAACPADEEKTSFVTIAGRGFY